MAKRSLRVDDIQTRHNAGRRTALVGIGGALVGLTALSACAPETGLAGFPLGKEVSTDCDRDIPNDYYPPADSGDIGAQKDISMIDSDTTTFLADPVGKGNGKSREPHPAASGDARLVAIEKPNCDSDV